MTWPFYVDPTLCSRLCLTLLHSVWQVALLALAAFGASRIGRRRSVERDYAFQVAALLASLFAIPVTFASISVVRPRAVEQIASSQPATITLSQTRFDLRRDPQTATNDARSTLSKANSDSIAGSASPPRSAVPYWVRLSPWVVGLYGIGLFLMLARLGVGVWHANRMGRRGTILFDGPLAELVRAMAAKWSMPIVPVLCAS
jgi:hypothetical protein